MTVHRTVSPLAQSFSQETLPGRPPEERRVVDVGAAPPIPPPTLHPALQQLHVPADVILPRPMELHAKLSRMRQAGINGLQVIADFDRTLTRFKKNDIMCDGSHGVIDNAQHLGDEFREKSKAVFNKYYPLEISIHLTKEEKLKYMEEWWTQAHQLYHDYHLKSEYLEAMVRSSTMALREEANDLLHSLSATNTPVYVFSAGIYNILETFLRHQNLLLPNMHIIANRMRFDSDGHLNGFEGALIHSLNKTGHLLLQPTAPVSFDEARPNALVLGDNTSDVQMADGLPFKDVIYVGFLNDRVSERREAYERLFDVVITNDGSMRYVRQLLSLIAGEPDHIAANLHPQLHKHQISAGMTI